MSNLPETLRPLLLHNLLPWNSASYFTKLFKRQADSHPRHNYRDNNNCSASISPVDGDRHLPIVIRMHTTGNSDQLAIRLRQCNVWPSSYELHSNLQQSIRRYLRKAVYYSYLCINSILVSSCDTAPQNSSSLHHSAAEKEDSVSYQDI